MTNNLISDQDLFKIIQDPTPKFCDQQKVNERYMQETKEELNTTGAAYYTKTRPYYLKLLPSKL